MFGKYESPQEEAAATLLAQEDFYFFSRWMFWHMKGFKWKRAKHHKIICDALTKVFNGEIRRLIINIPPRYSKTELAVVMFVAWCLGKAPDSEFIHASYAATLAGKNSAAILSIIQHPAYRKIFPEVQLETQAQHHWKTTRGGVMFATGVGGSCTGYGAGKLRKEFGGAIIIDDPHKAKEANSDQVRESVIDWYSNTLDSRGNGENKSTPVILIMQRLHEKDLAGHLLSGGNGEKWEHICLSVWQEEEYQGEDGETYKREVPLWPEKHSAETLRIMERVDAYVFSGQYRQMPSPPAGGIFKPGNIEIVDAVPTGRIQWVRGWDLASLQDDGDYTAGGKLGKLDDGRYIIGDIEEGQMGPDERDRTILNTAKKDGKSVRISIPQDPGQAGKTQALYMVRMLSGYTAKATPESGDKVTRAEPLAAQVNVGNVLMLKGSWNDRLIEQMRMFPYGANDDMVDSLSRAFAEFVTNKFGMLDFMAAQAAKLEAEQQAKEEAH